jgi:hypothetical protein
MDPYLEIHWRDVHARLVAGCSDALNAALPDDLLARIEERVAIESANEIARVIYPDVRVIEDSTRSTSSTSTSAATVAQPIVIEVEPEPATEGYVTIRDSSGERIITVIEFLSPSNKRGEGLKDYLDKRSKLIDGGVNVVEVDLVRQGDWRPLMKPKVVHPRAHTTYRVMSRRASNRRRVDYFPISLRQRLPIIPIPLRATDKDVTLDLQSIVEQAYRNGRYDRTDYSKPCEPPLVDEDLTWTAELIKSASSRSEPE